MMTMTFVRILTSLLILFIVHCDATFRFANYLQDHMVLQRAPQRAIIWGYTDSNSTITLTINNQIHHTTSTQQNETIWSITLDPISNEGPFDIHASQTLPNGTVAIITLHDVLFGDVWICSGQSNMEMAVIDIFNGTLEIANAGNYPKIRLFTSARNASDQLIDELLGMWLNWSVASRQSVGGPTFYYMSAVCWLYGRMIHQALNNRPIGLVAASWNGTAIEYWMPPQALQECNISSEIALPKVYDQSVGELQISHSSIYNAMTYPFTRMVIYGVIWYQGEGNADIPTRDYYPCEFAKMIEYWRQMWFERTNGNTDRQFPFGFVQIGTRTTLNETVGGFPWIRWHQTFDVGYVPNHVVPKVFMGVALDLRDDPNHTHPRYKHDVAYRLSRAGLAIAYNQTVEFQGPIVSNVTYTSGGPSLNITYTAVAGIELRNPNGFEVCCQGQQCQNDTSWIAATITKKSGRTIEITIPDACVCQDLYGIRYLWHETPCLFKQAAVYSATDSNLPSPPYIKIF